MTVNEISNISRPETNQSSYNVQLNVDEQSQKKLSSPPPSKYRFQFDNQMFMELYTVNKKLREVALTS